MNFFFKSLTFAMPTCWNCNNLYSSLCLLRKIYIKFINFVLCFVHINSLLKPETVEEIIKHITTEPPPELEERIRFKKAYVACGLFAAGYNRIENVIVSNEHLFNNLIQFLEQPTPLHPLLASFFTKCMSGCLQKQGKQTLKLFQKRTNMLDLLVKHIETSAIMDLIEIFFSVTRQIELDKEDEQVSLIGLVIIFILLAFKLILICFQFIFIDQKSG